MSSPVSARDDDLMGAAGPDSLTGEGGNDTLTGGDGLDIAILQGAQNLYTLTIGDEITLTDRSGVDGTDILRGVEFLDFSDGRFDVTRFDDGVTLTGG